MDSIEVATTLNYMYYKEDKRESNGVYVRCLTREQAGYCV